MGIGPGVSSSGDVQQPSDVKYNPNEIKESEGRFVLKVTMGGKDFKVWKLAAKGETATSQSTQQALAGVIDKMRGLMTVYSGKIDAATFSGAKDDPTMKITYSSDYAATKGEEGPKGAEKNAEGKWEKTHKINEDKIDDLVAKANTKEAAYKRAKLRGESNIESLKGKFDQAQAKLKAFTKIRTSFQTVLQPQKLPEGGFDAVSADEPAFYGTAPAPGYEPAEGTVEVKPEDAGVYAPAPPREDASAGLEEAADAEVVYDTAPPPFDASAGLEEVEAEESGDYGPILFPDDASAGRVKQQVNGYGKMPLSRDGQETEKTNYGTMPAGPEDVGDDGAVSTGHYRAMKLPPEEKSQYGPGPPPAARADSAQGKRVAEDSGIYAGAPPDQRSPASQYDTPTPYRDKMEGMLSPSQYRIVSDAESDSYTVWYKDAEGQLQKRSSVEEGFAEVMEKLTIHSYEMRDVPPGVYVLESDKYLPEETQDGREIFWTNTEEEGPRYRPHIPEGFTKGGPDMAT